ncbi:MAG: hypothetical protein SGARI_004772, partial [Bacillariaceae sp.]
MGNTATKCTTVQESGSIASASARVDSEQSDSQNDKGLQNTRSATFEVGSDEASAEEKTTSADSQESAAFNASLQTDIGTFTFAHHSDYSYVEKKTPITRRLFGCVKQRRKRSRDAVRHPQPSTPTQGTAPILEGKQKGWNTPKSNIDKTRVPPGEPALNTLFTPVSKLNDTTKEDKEKFAEHDLTPPRGTCVETVFPIVEQAIMRDFGRKPWLRRKGIFSTHAGRKTAIFLYSRRLHECEHLLNKKQRIALVE